MIDLTCSIVLFRNNPEELRPTVECFLRSNGKKLYLIDNSENDDLRFEFDHPKIEYIFPGKNIGFGAANNLILDKIKKESKYHLILNPDVLFEPSVLDSLFAFMESNLDVGLVMPKVLYRNGDLQYLCKKLPAPGDLFLRRFIPGPVKPFFKKMMESYELKFKDYNSVMEVPNLSGCFMFVRTDTYVKVGGFDEQYFLYLEDTDLSRRLNEVSRTVYYPRVHIIHGFAKGSYKNFKLLKYHVNSSIRYFNKWGWFVDKPRESINRTLLGKATVRQNRPQLVIPA